MNTLNFETGLVTYEINGKCEVSFNPTDSAFIERLYAAFETLDKKQDAYKEQVTKLANKKEIFGFAKECDAEMREIIDGVFEKPLCQALFGGMSVYSVASGLPVWCNFLLAIMDEVDTTFTREKKATDSRIAKYTAKYHK